MSLRHSCDGKVQYSTFHRAAKAAQTLRRAKSAHAQAYSCKGCGSFHVGNTIGGALDGRLRRQRLNKIIERETRP